MQDMPWPLDKDWLQRGECLQLWACGATCWWWRKTGDWRSWTPTRLRCRNLVCRPSHRGRSRSELALRWGARQAAHARAGACTCTASSSTWPIRVNTTLSASCYLKLLGISPHTHTQRYREESCVNAVVCFACVFWRFWTIRQDV